MHRRALVLLATVVAMVLAGPPAVAGPPPATPLTGVAAVTPAAAGLSTCARLAGGQVRCWGGGQAGALGNGGTDDHHTPVAVSNAAGTGPLRGTVQVVGAGGTFCALLQAGQVRCWGEGRNGELGTGDEQDHLRPAVVRNPAGTRPLTDVAQVTAGWEYFCARKSAGTVVCWGNNSYRQLGTRTSGDRSLPVAVRYEDGSLLTGARDVAAGANHACAVVGEARRAVCWGYNRTGQLGDGTRTGSLGAVVVRPNAPLTGVFDLVTGSTHTCALLTDGRARCWGDNRKGQLGDGTTASVDLPIPISNEDDTGPLTDVVQLSGGRSATCALLESTEVRCWGWGDQGQLGNAADDDQTLPVPVVVASGGDPLTDVRQVAIGYAMACATLVSGEVRCWGGNNLGQLGDGSTTPSNVPVTVVS